MFRAALLLLLLPACAPAAAASFDCGKAGTKVEKLVCASPELGRLDERLASAFDAIGPEPEGNEWGRWAPRVDDQRRWLRDIRDACGDEACLRDAYVARIEVLERWHEPAPDDVAGQYEVEHVVAFVAGDGLEKEPATDCLSLLPRKQGGYDVAIASLQTNGHTCAVTGIVRPDSGGLAMVAGSAGDSGDACVLRIVTERGELRIEDPDATCSDWCGARARLDGLRFPRGTKRAGAPQACPGFEE